MRYTSQELDAHALADLLADATAAERQALEGPYYPERGITAESLRAYAVECRGKAERFATGGAHKAALAPSAVDVGTVTEYGLTQRLSKPIRCF